MKDVDTTTVATEETKATVTSEKKPVAKTGKKFPLTKKEVVIGGASFVFGVLTGVGSIFGINKIKSSKKK